MRGDVFEPVVAERSPQCGPAMRAAQAQRRQLQQHIAPRSQVEHLRQVAGLERGQVQAARPVIDHHAEAPQLRALEEHVVACAEANQVFFKNKLQQYLIFPFLLDNEVLFQQDFQCEAGAFSESLSKGRIALFQ